MLSSDFSWLAKSLLRSGGWGMAVHIEAHFDESGTHSDQITIAGYLFEQARIDRFCEEWERLLRLNDIPFLHMTDFAPGNPPYDKIPNRTQLQMKFMRLIKSYSINGVVCNINNNIDNIGNSYAQCVDKAVSSVIKWADDTAYAGKIAYIFEAGATGHGLVEQRFSEIARCPSMAASHRYAGHGFVPKINNPGVQAADFLA